MGYKVISPLVIVRDPAGRMHHFYADAVLPEGLDPEHLKQLKADGMILDEKAAAKAEATPDEDDKPAPAKKTAAKSADSK